MTDGTDRVLSRLLSGNDRHVEALETDYFADVRAEQHPDVVSVCCSDSRVPQEGMWDVAEPGRVFTPSNIGNQVWDERDGERIVDGSVLYPLHHTGTEAAAIVGHTGCGAITGAYRVAMGGDLPETAGVAKWIDLLQPVIEAGLESDAVNREGQERSVVNQLVEYNVDYQAGVLHQSDAIPENVSVYGFVYDLHGVYDGVPGRAYLVNLDGETEPDAIRERVPATYAGAIDTLLG